VGGRGGGGITAPGAVCGDGKADLGMFGAVCGGNGGVGARLGAAAWLESEGCAG
jgi:hypothetical protein